VGEREEVFDVFCDKRKKGKRGTSFTLEGGGEEEAQSRGGGMGWGCHFQQSSIAGGRGGGGGVSFGAFGGKAARSGKNEFKEGGGVIATRGKEMGGKAFSEG